MDSHFDVAKQEYFSENEDGRFKLVYTYFGLSIYFGQCLEETFSIMLWTDRIFKNKVRTNQEVNQIIDGIENSKKTMGNFISEVRKSYALSDSVRVELDKILADRNYLVHKYFKLNIEKFYSEIGRLEMIELFCKFCDDSKKMEEQLKHYYKMYTDKLGITDEQITKIINDIKQQ